MPSRTFATKPTQTAEANKSAAATLSPPTLTFSDRRADQLPAEKTPQVNAPKFSGNFAGVPVTSPPDQRGSRYPLFHAPIRPSWPIQAKLEVGAVDDPLEREADEIADKVLRSPKPERQHACAWRGSCSTYKTNLDVHLQTKGDSQSDVGAEVETAIRRTHGDGQALDRGVRAQMELALGADFSGVRVHTDGEADVLNQTLSARAFTCGQAIFFRSGHFQPETLAGQRLLAHELTHVVQQGGVAPAAGGPLLGEPDEARQRKGPTPTETLVEPTAPATVDPNIVPISRAQETGGSQYGSQLVQRAPDSRSREPKTPPKKPVDGETASKDYSDANTYMVEFYQGLTKALTLIDHLRANAETNYENFTKLKDPPSVYFAILKSVLSSALAAVPGGAIISAGLEAGLFARDLGKLKLELEEQPIPGMTVEDEKRRGPGAELKEKAKKGSEHIKNIGEGGAKIIEAVKDTLKEQREAEEAEAQALKSADIRRQRIAEWADLEGLVQRQQDAVTEWIKAAGKKQGLRGRILAAVTARLGPILFVDTIPQDPIEKHYELELYRDKYKPNGRCVIYQGESYSLNPILEVPGDLAEGTRKRIADCAGVTKTDDGTMAKVLGIPISVVTVEQKQNFRPL